MRLEKVGTVLAFETFKVETLKLKLQKHVKFGIVTEREADSAETGNSRGGCPVSFDGNVLW